MSSHSDYADTASVASTAAKISDPVKKAWCQTQWCALSYQARALGLPDVYFDHETALLSKEQNKQLWKLLVGPELGNSLVYWSFY